MGLHNINTHACDKRICDACLCLTLLVAEIIFEEKFFFGTRFCLILTILKINLKLIYSFYTFQFPFCAY